MRNQLLLALFFFAVAHTTQAQCDAKQYALIYAEAQVLQEQGQFIEAKNKYEAAKIYACGGNDLDKADKAVDALFEQIERLRLEMTTARDSTEVEKRNAQKAVISATINDLIFKSKLALKEGDRNTAFRISEFAHRYIDSNDIKIRQALLEVFYFNDDPSHEPIPRVLSLNGHTDAISSMALNPDETILVVGDYSGSIYLWNMKQKQLIRKINAHSSDVKCVAFSKDGQFLATASCDATVKIWLAGSWVLSRTIKGHRNCINSIAFTEDSKYLATGSSDKSVKIWELKEESIPVQTLLGFNFSVSCVVFSPNNQWLGTGEGEPSASTNSCRIWDWKSGKEMTQFEEGAPVTSLAFSPDNQMLSISSGSIFKEGYNCNVWDVKLNKKLISIRENEGLIQRVAFSPDGSQLAFTTGDQVKIYDLGSGQISHKLVGHVLGIKDLMFSADGKFLFTGSLDRTVRIWAVNQIDRADTLDIFNLKGSLVVGQKHIVQPLSIAFSRDGKTIATCSFSDTKTRLWEVSTGHQLDSLDFVAASLQFSPTADYLAIGTTSGLIKIWDFKTSQTKSTFSEGESSVNFIAFDSTGQYLLAKYSNNAIKVWDLKQNYWIKSFSTEGKDANNSMIAALSNDFKKIATSYGWPSPKSQGDVCIWDVETGVKTIALEGYFYDINSLAFSPDGKILATASENNTVKIWDLDSRKVVWSFAHSSPINSIAFFSNGKEIASGTGQILGKDNSIKIWDITSGNEIVNLSGHRLKVEKIIISPDGNVLASGSEDGVVKIWNISPEKVIQLWRDAYPLVAINHAQLQQYNLEMILSLYPENEQKLIATQETWQIKAFADLSASQAAGSNILSRVEPHFARADRLYAAALALQDEALIRMDYAKMLRRWAEVYQSDGLEAKAAELNAKANGLWQEKD